MKGTEKQIAWAEDIKAKVMAALDAMSNTAMKEQFEAFSAWIGSKDSASWWINSWQMTGTVRMFLRKAMREFKA